MLKLDEIYEIPKEFFELTSPRDLHKIFPNPTLLHLEGRKKEILFVATLLHGNETSGFFALQKLLAKHKNLPRSISIFFGNIKAAKNSQRRLDNQPDFNRVWPSHTETTSPETQLMAEITQKMVQKKLFAFVDIHNNTGKNPHYGCINDLDKKSIALAYLFSKTIVYFTNPKGVAAMAFAPFCPSIAIECGKSDLEAGQIHAFEFLDALLHTGEIEPLHHNENVKIFQTKARILIPPEKTFGFDNENTDINLLPKLDLLNFSELEVGTIFGFSKNAIFWALDDENKNISHQFFKNENGQIKLIKSAMPSMLTLDERVIRQDCLCYLMEEITQN